MSKYRWLVFYTRPRSEKKAELRLLDQGMEVLVPKCEEIRQWSDRKKKVIVPLFRGYLFASVDERSRIQVLQTPEIVCDVKFSGQPAELREEEVENLRIIQDKPDLLEAESTTLPQVGEKVIVEEGPFKGLTGEVVDHNNITHILVRIEAIGQAAKVNIPGSAVKVIDSRAKSG